MHNAPVRCLLGFLFCKVMQKHQTGEVGKRSFKAAALKGRSHNARIRADTRVSVVIELIEIIDGHTDRSAPLHSVRCVNGP